MKRAYLTLVSLLVTTLVVVGTAPAQAAAKKDPSDSRHDLTISIYHEAVSPISVTGSGLGAVRTFFIPMAINGKAGDSQFLSATLTTVAQNMPEGKELRSSNFAFVMGDLDNQITVSGVALYAPSGSVLPVGARVIRPVTGGTGKYEGAVGECISTNLGDRGWTHVLKLFLPR